MLDENHLVEKSKSLVWARCQGYSSGALKILDTYLSRINAREPESAEVIFTKREYARIMGLDPDIRTTQLQTYTQELLGKVVTIELPHKEGYDQYTLFPTARCYYDEKTKQVLIKIRCNEDLREVFFHLAENRYIKYRLRNTLALGSKYSVALYPRLLDKPRGWIVPVDELREEIGATKASYKAFKNLRNVLQAAIDEINEVTDITVSMEAIKQGRNIVAVKFAVKKKCEVEVLDAPDDAPDAPELPELPEPPKEDGPLDMVMAVLPEGFTREQGEMLYSLAVDHLPYTVASFDEKHLWISDYVQGKVRLMRSQRKPVAKNAQYSWLRKAVEKDWK